MAEKKSLSKIIIGYAGKEYEFTGGGGAVGADSVGTEEIKDGSIQMADLSDEVVGAMGEKSTYDEEDEQLTLGN